MSEVKETELALLVKDSGLEENAALALQKAFEPFYNQAKEWERLATELVIEGEDDKAGQLKAREARLQVVKVGTGIESLRVEMKANSLKYGKLVDAIAKLHKDIIEPTKEILKAKEETKLRADNERKAKIKGEREALLQPLGVDTTYFNLADMPQAQFDTLLSDQQNAYNQRLEDERQAKEAAELAAKKQELERVRRIEIAPYAKFENRECELSDFTDAEWNSYMAATKKLYDADQAEQKRIREENEQLRKQQAEAAAKQQQISDLRNQRNAILRKYNYIHESDIAELSEAIFNDLVSTAKLAHEEKEMAALEAETKAKKELAERNRLAAELKAKEDAEALRQLKESQDKEAELAKGDKEKMQDLINRFEDIKNQYAFKSAKHKAIFDATLTMISKMVEYIKNKQ